MGTFLQFDQIIVFKVEYLSMLLKKMCFQFDWNISPLWFKDIYNFTNFSCMIKIWPNNCSESRAPLNFKHFSLPIDYCFTNEWFLGWLFISKQGGVKIYSTESVTCHFKEYYLFFQRIICYLKWPNPWINLDF